MHVVVVVDRLDAGVHRLRPGPAPVDDRLRERDIVARDGPAHPIHSQSPKTANRAPPRRLSTSRNVKKSVSYSPGSPPSASNAHLDQSHRTARCLPVIKCHGFRQFDQSAGHCPPIGGMLNCIEFPTSGRYLGVAIDPLQSKFIDEYLSSGNATDAAIKAGYSPDSARQQGSRLLTKAYIRAELERRRAKLAERTLITQEMAITALAPILFSNIGQFGTWKNNQLELFDADSIDDEAMEAISEITCTPGKYGTTIRIKLHDKLAAWEKVGRMLGFFKERSPLKEMIDALSAADPEMGEALRSAIAERVKARKRPGTAEPKI